MLNVKDFGAIGDGSNDDTVSFNSALVESKNRNQKVFVPSGRYNLHNNLKLNIKTGVFGESRMTTTLRFLSMDSNNFAVDISGNKEGGYNPGSSSMVFLENVDLECNVPCLGGVRARGSDITVNNVTARSTLPSSQRKGDGFLFENYGTYGKPYPYNDPMPSPSPTGSFYNRLSTPIADNWENGIKLTGTISPLQSSTTAVFQTTDKLHFFDYKHGRKQNDWVWFPRHILKVEIGNASIYPHSRTCDVLLSSEDAQKLQGITKVFVSGLLLFGSGIILNGLLDCEVDELFLTITLPAEIATPIKFGSNRTPIILEIPFQLNDVVIDGVKTIDVVDENTWTVKHNASVTPSTTAYTLENMVTIPSHILSGSNGLLCLGGRTSLCDFGIKLTASDGNLFNNFAVEDSFYSGVCMEAGSSGNMFQGCPIEECKVSALYIGPDCKWNSEQGSRITSVGQYCIDWGYKSFLIPNSDWSNGSVRLSGRNVTGGLNGSTSHGISNNNVSLYAGTSRADGAFIELDGIKTQSNTKWSIGYATYFQMKYEPNVSGKNILSIAANTNINGQIVFSTNKNNNITVDELGNLLPSSNTQTLGTSNRKWKEIYADSIFSTSDIQLKKDVKYVIPSLYDNIHHLSAIEWTDNGKRNFGFSAQDVLQMFGENTNLVTKNENGELAINYNQLMVVLLTALKGKIYDR